MVDSESNQCKCPRVPCTGALWVKECPHCHTFECEAFEDRATFDPVAARRYAETMPGWASAGAANLARWALDLNRKRHQDATSREAELEMLIEATYDALSGHAVSEFALSFEIVNRARERFLQACPSPSEHGK